MSDTIQERLRRFSEYDSEDNHTDPREHICTEAADEIDRLRAELDEEREAYKTALSNRNYWRRAQRKELLLKEHAERELAEKDKRIEELEDDKAFWKNPPNGVWVEKDWINAAWELWSKYKDMGARAALAELGIKACEECEGVGVGVSEHCTNCSGNGWVMEE